MVEDKIRLLIVEARRYSGLSDALLQGAAQAHLAGIALEAGGSLILDRAAFTAEADRLGLFVIGVKP